MARINELKGALNAIILAHNYMVPALQDLGDIVGDSLELARKAAETDAEVIVFLGVTFMGETAKILCPDKQVLMPRLDARCPMAEMVRAPQVLKMKEQYPGAPVVAYVNTLAEVKALADICCTSANALKIFAALPEEEIVFVPDRSLGAYLQRMSNKTVHFAHGYCPTHHRIRAEDILRLKAEHPDACVLVHPECTGEVLDVADRIGSTSAIVRFVGELKDQYRRFIIGTEKGLIYRLQQLHPEIEFYLPSELVVCPTMKKNRLEYVVDCMENRAPEITIPEGVRVKALASVERMLAVK
ncbi:MAG: quinolinate synthase [Candidatus Riflebacteria bacterium RBG_13_59_9]|nr:MAG: quinolinate synthase [Candidatus Riflebacteria bacterium RBG_13_59_9]